MEEHILLAVLLAWFIGGAVLLAGGLIAERGRPVIFPGDARRATRAGTAAEPRSARAVRGRKSSGRKREAKPQ